MFSTSLTLQKKDVLSIMLLIEMIFKLILEPQLPMGVPVQASVEQLQEIPFIRIGVTLMNLVVNGLSFVDIGTIVSTKLNLCLIST